MSRRKRSDVDHDYGAVRFVCPSGHELAPTAVLDGDDAHLFGMKPGVAVFRDTPNGGKLLVRCVACERAGRRPDLQANWPRVLDAMRAAAPDPARGVITVTLGGGDTP